jgi:hypothetical protein
VHEGEPQRRAHRVAARLADHPTTIQNRYDLLA